ncbi:acyl-CoA thioesterase [Noviherbaspirillum sedimenti]|uniref:Acyl-CoA thioesterase n=1 Tax=Noviherbaspirillum sedimenti TaxID=2320865 RepID=A0A3A3FXN3_9BURK|nr:thioesterase family protein [Noviherbaspirillum sedimenti]RJG00381.1 acyl-CoA thioesterase [Noviherbaspirillum sedimenti]
MFNKEKLVRFQHCDPAGIVFYPQYIILFHELMEDWFNEGLGVNYAESIMQRRMGLPIVKLECEFLAPGFMGNVLAMQLEVKHLGTSSVTLGVRASIAGRECVRATLKLVHTSLAELKAVPIPAALRELMLQFHSPTA